MDIKQLRYFVEVARREHISDAALELNIAQSAISRQITQLEKELGVTLFKRSGRNIILTVEGRQLLSQATQILELMDKTIHSFQQHVSHNQQTIYIGYEESDASQMILPLIQTFEQQSNSTMIPQLTKHDKLLDQILSNQLDLAITEFTPVLERETHLRVMPLFEENYHMYVPKSHPLAMTIHPPLSQFTNQSLYCLEPMTSSIKSKLIEKTKAQVRMISDMKLAQHILSHNKGFIISSQNSLLYDHVNWTKIPLNHTELKRMLCVVMRKDNKKNDINIAWNLIYTLLNKSTIN